MRATFDSLLAILLVTLEAPQLTAIPLHEVLGAVIAVLLVFHLLLQRNLFAQRRRLHASLNVALFVALTLAIVSGFAVSKWLVPTTHTPGGFLTWREIHDTSSRWAVLIVGLHVGMNWRRLFSGLSLRPIARRLVPVALLIVVAVGATVAVERFLPPVRTVTFITPDGKRQLVPPPPQIVNLRPEQRTANVRRALPPLAAMSILFFAGAGISAAVVRPR